MPHLYGLQTPVRERARRLLQILHRRIDTDGTLPVRSELRRIAVYADAFQTWLLTDGEWMDASKVLRDEISRRIAPHSSVNAWLSANHRDFYLALHKEFGLAKGTQLYRLAWIESLIYETLEPQVRIAKEAKR